MSGKTGTLRRLLAAAITGVVLVGLAGCSTNADVLSKLPTQAAGSLPKTMTTQLDAAATAAMTRAGASGAIVGVWAPWAGSWKMAKGTTRPKGGTKMSTNMSFRISSNTKSMTCTVLLALAQAGKVKLDDPVSKYLPRVVGLSTITLGQLCRNTSGLADYASGLGSQFVNNPTRQWVPMELVSDGLAEPATAAPGANYANSNTGFILLGMALSAATGRSWDDLYDQYVWVPLKMVHTTLPDPGTLTMPSPHADGVATAVDAAGTPQCGTVVDETELSSSMTWTAGGVVSTLGDLKTYSQALAEGTLLDPEYSKKQWTTTRVSNTAPTWQGYGMGATTLGPMRGNAGNIPGFITSTLSDPTSGLTVVVMLNNSTVGGNFAQLLGMQLASIASKAAATSGKAPTIALPWSQEQMAAAMATNTICPPAGVTPAPADPANLIPQFAG